MKLDIVVEILLQDKNLLNAKTCEDLSENSKKFIKEVVTELTNKIFEFISNKKIKTIEFSIEELAEKYKFSLNARAIKIIYSELERFRWLQDNDTLIEKNSRQNQKIVVQLIENKNNIPTLRNSIYCKTYEKKLSIYKRNNKEIKLDDEETLEICKNFLNIVSSVTSLYKATFPIINNPNYPN